MLSIRKSFLCAAMVLPTAALADGHSSKSNVTCGETYTVARGDSLSGIGMRAYGSFLYQPIFTANVDVIGLNPDLIRIGQRLVIPCLTAEGDVVNVDAEVVSASADPAPIEGQLTFTFNKASAPPFIINSGIIDAYLSDITEVTEGRITFVDPEVINRDHSQQLELVTSGQVDGAYVLNVHLEQSHPLLQLPMQPMFGGSAEQTAVSMWRLHDEYLSAVDYFPQAHLLGFVASPAAHIWHDESMPVQAGQKVAFENDYAIPYFNGLDTRGPAVMREEVAQFKADNAAQGEEEPIYFLAHGAAIALGIWNEESTMSVMEVDYGLYTPTFSVVLSNDAWAQISPADQQAIADVSGEALAHRSAAWDDFDNAFRARMMERGLKFEKADKALLDDLFINSFEGLNTWMSYADSMGVSGSAAVNYYLENLRELDDRLLYRGDASTIEQHPFVTNEL